MTFLLRAAPLTITLVLASFVACGDSGGEGSSGGAGSDATAGSTKAVSTTGATATGTTQATTTGATTSVTGATTTGASSSSGGACNVPAPVYNPEGCLTVPSAQTICGFQSNEEICDFAVGCGISESVSQCQINCEQGTSSFCNDMTMTTCMIESFCTQDCARLMTCGFIL